MAKFCTKCGRPLQEGEVCACQSATGALGGQQQVPPQQQAEGQQVSPQQNMGQQVSPQQNMGQQVPPQGQGWQQVPPQQQTMGQPTPMQPNAGSQGMEPQIPPQGGWQQVPPQQNMGQQIPPQGQEWQQVPPQGQGWQQVPPQQNMGQQVPPQNQFGIQATAFAQSFFTRLMNLIKHPVTAGKEMIVTADIKVAMMMIVFQGIMSGLFAMAVAQRCSHYIQAASGIASSIGGGNVGNILSMPYIRILLVTILFSVALACILALLLMLGHMVIKAHVSYQQMLSAAAIRSSVLTPAILLSIIIFELTTGFGLSLFLLVNIWGFAAMLVTMSSFIEEKKLNTFVLVMSVALLIFVAVTFFIFSKIWTFYLPDVLRTALSGLEKLSGGDLLRELMNGF